jgi:hypothetical protein
MPAVHWVYGNWMDSRDINNHDMRLGRNQKTLWGSRKIFL